MYVCMVDNPNYQKIIDSYAHLQGVHMDDIDSKLHLPVHLILGASEYAAVKTTERPRTGLLEEPAAFWPFLNSELRQVMMFSPSI